MPTLLLVNGAPGVGKSTFAAALAAERSLAYALDIDVIKHGLGGWARDVEASGMQARRLGLALAAQQLADGYDVVVGQYLARPEFIEQLEDLAGRTGAAFVEVVLVLGPEALGQRLAARIDRPDRPEHQVNNSLVGPADATDLVASIQSLAAQRPHAVLVDASGSLEQTLATIRTIAWQR